jgi:hypothetical protein
LPFLELTLNGSALVCAGSEKITVLAAGVIVTAAGGHAQINVSGLRQSGSDEEFLFWTSSDFVRGGSIQIALLQRATSVSGLKVLEPSELIRDTEEDLAEMKRRIMPSRSQVCVSPPRASWPIAFLIRVDQGDPIEAAIGEEENLQAEVTFTQNGWALRADALTVLDDGSTKGRCWTKQDLAFGQVVELVYKT